MRPKLQEELLLQPSRLPEEQQKQVLAFAKGLAQAISGVSGKNFLKFSGSIGHDDLQSMTKVIEEGCERIDPSEW
ncbi:MAG: hypothetical protein OEV08_10455 [Nitrospira sp.]|nr:hypothetical protein [Nitrospira sp.]